MSFKDLKRNSTAQLEKLTAELAKINQNSFGNKDDANTWSCQTDKVGNGYAVIRFLPAPDGEDVPFARMWSHGFKGPTGNWYIENSLTTIGGQDPLSELNSKLWNTGLESDKEVARKQKRKLSYYSNIYVVKDPANPENEGKVMLFRYGKKIFDKLNDLMNPQFEDEDPVNPFCLWTGANFKLKIRQVEGYANYDKSEFDSPGPLLSDDDELETIWKSEVSLTALTAPDKFKSYDELKARLNKVLGQEGSSSRNTEEAIPEESAKESRSKSEPSSKSKDYEEKDAPASSSDDDDDGLAFFKNLVEED